VYYLVLPDSSTYDPQGSPSRIRQLARRTLATALPRALFVTQGPRSSRSVCVTFDDGPHPELTPRLLDVLAKEEIKATFFVVGQRAEKHPDIVRRMEAEGHVVGHHSHSHPDPVRTPILEMYRDVRAASRVLREILGHPARFYRPPHGKLRPADLPLIWSLRQTIVLWNVDPKDFAQPSAVHLGDWFATRPLRGGDLILLHDWFPQALAAMPTLAARVRREGLQFGSLEQWTRWLPVETW
jgi:peptidoglycan/xylan/chitin deacetylase (PgdA/CDA1 family)